VTFAMRAPVALSAGVLRLVVAVASAIALTNLLAFAAGVAPREALRVAVDGALASTYGLGQIVFRATPILLTALAARVTLLAGLFNIGVEGQLAGASLAVGVVGSWCGSAAVPSFPGLVLMFATAALVGALIASIPGALRARFGGSEVIGGIVVNQLVAVAVGFLLRTRFAVAGTMRTASLPEGLVARPLGRWWQALAGTPVTAISALVFAGVPLAYLALERMRMAREWELVAEAPEACAFAGIPVARRRLQALAWSGAVAGLVALPMVAGYKGYAEPGLGAGTGFAGLAVAMLGGSSAAVTVAAALWFGLVDQAGLALHALVPKDLVLIVQASTMLVAALLGFRKHTARMS
jgi:simple sugar transport system permease protein